MVLRSCVAALVPALFLVGAARAFAADASAPRATTSAEEGGVRYEAPADCPTVSAYVARVEQRLGPDWAAALARFAKRVQVTISVADGHYLGTLELVNERGERFSRAVSGAVCSEVVDGVGLMTALAVQARSNESAPQREEQTSEVSPTHARPLEVPESRTASTTAMPGNTANHAVAPRSARVRLRLGARAAVTSGVAPELVVGPGAFALLELGRARVGLSGDAFTANEVRTSLARADFRLLSLRLEGCPWSFELRGWATLEPCAAGELGSFRVAPHLNPPALTVSEPKAVTWGAVDVVARLALRLSPFVATIELVGRMPLRREHFYVGSREQVIFQIPALSAGASVGLGLRF